MERIEVLQLEKEGEGHNEGANEGATTDGNIALPSSNSSSTTAKGKQSTDGSIMRRGGRKILMGDSFWTVLHRTKDPLLHPFAPPEPFSDRLSNLKTNKRIRATHITATNRPRWLREEGGNTEGVNSKQNGAKRKRAKFGYDVVGGLTNTLGGKKALEDVRYRKVYQPPKDMSKDVLPGGGGGIERSRDVIKRTAKKFDMKVGIKVTRRPTSSILPEKPKKEDSHRIYEVKELDPDSIPPEEIKNIEGNNALQCLHHLEALRVLDSIEWEEANGESELFEIIKVRIKGPTKDTGSNSSPLSGMDLVFEKERPLHMITRQRIKHHIALMAIRNIVGPDKQWTVLTTKGMRDRFLPPPPRVQQNASRLNAVECLSQLRDSKLLTLTWDYVPHPELKGQEAVHLCIRGGEGLSSFDFEFEETREFQISTRNPVKHRIAIKALERILGNENNWEKMTFLEMKNHMKSCILI